MGFRAWYECHILVSGLTSRNVWHLEAPTAWYYSTLVAATKVIDLWPQTLRYSNVIGVSQRCENMINTTVSCHVRISIRQCRSTDLEGLRQTVL